MNIEKILKKIEVNPNKVEIEVLKKFFPQCFDKEGNFLIEKFKNIVESKTNISKETYSLEWLGKSYARVLASERVRTFIKENKEWNEKRENKNSENLLIKGDNLEVLKHMVNAYYEKIDMIYIDPPYNTGKDGFVYQDNRKFTPEELSSLSGISIEKAKRILNFVNSKSNSHSAWLTFMYPRLYIARDLLKDNGVIFISIDDNEVAQLRLLMDEIFGEENFGGKLIWRKKAGGGNDSADIAIEHEYILIYFKDKVVNFRLPLKEETLKSYKYKDEKYEELGRYKLKDLNDPSLSDSKGLHYDIICPDGTVLKGNENQWKCNYETFQKRLEDNRIIFKKDKNNKWKVYYKIYLNEEKGQIKRDKKGNIVQKKRKPESILYEIAFNKDGNQDLKYLFENTVIFKYPKPVKLLMHLLNMLNNDECIVLDFFAGSGTTADAVMQLNAKDGGKRKFILVQLPEPIDPKKNNVAYNFLKENLGMNNPTVFDICKERLVRVADKTKKDNQEKDLSNLDLGFKIFETIDLPQEYIEDIEELDENTFLFFPQIDKNSLLTTWKLYDGAEFILEPIEIDLGGYKTYLINKRLYLINEGFTTSHLIAMLKKIDEKNDFNPSTIVANGYVFGTKTQREIYEAIKNFISKKHIDLEFIIRC